MISRTELEGKWNQVKGRVLEQWSELTDDELQQARGNYEQLTGLIQEKTGESKKNISNFLDEVISDSANVAQKAGETAQHYAERAKEVFYDQYGHVSESMREGYAQAEGMVRRNPVESVAVAFGAGLVAGAIVGLILKSK
jgi:uncharacterized protein YjbJ (UPF0337 family)